MAPIHNKLFPVKSVTILYQSAIYIYLYYSAILILQFQHLIDKVFHNFLVLQSQFCSQYLSNIINFTIYFPVMVDANQ